MDWEKALESVGTIAGIFFGWAHFNRKRTEGMRQERERWSLGLETNAQLIHPDAAPWRLLKLVRPFAGAPRMRLKQIRLVGPGKARLTVARQALGSERPKGSQIRPFMPEPEKAARCIVVEQDLAPAMKLTDGVSPYYVPGPNSEIWLFVELPRRSFWRRSARVKLRVIAEEISPRRPKITLTVKTEEIALTKIPTTSFKA